MIDKLMKRGTLNIDEAVFSVIASSVLTDIKEVSGTVSSIKDGLHRMINKQGQGIIAYQDDAGVVIKLKLSVHLDNNLPEICQNVQQLVKTEIETLTGVHVSAVDISVEEIVFPCENS